MCFQKINKQTKKKNNMRQICRFSHNFLQTFHNKSLKPVLNVEPKTSEATNIIIIISDGEMISFTDVFYSKEPQLMADEGFQPAFTDRL